MIESVKDNNEKIECKISEKKHFCNKQKDEVKQILKNSENDKNVDIDFKGKYFNKQKNLGIMNGNVINRNKKQNDNKGQKNMSTINMSKAEKLTLRFKNY